MDGEHRRYDSFLPVIRMLPAICFRPFIEEFRLLSRFQILRIDRAEEKLQMIYQYFLREAGILKKEILVSRTVLQDMQEFRYDGNVGELINIIQYMCGSALLNSEGGDIHITRECYPDYLFAQIKNREIQRQWKKFGFAGRRYPEIVHQTNPVYNASISFFVSS